MLLACGVCVVDVYIVSFCFFLFVCVCVCWFVCFVGLVELCVCVSAIVPVCVGLFQVLLFVLIWSLFVGTLGFAVVDIFAVCVCGGVLA